MGFRLIILVPVWGRPKLTRIVLSYYSNLRLKDISIRVVAAISPEDPHYRDHLGISGVHHFMHPNYPVSDKWNAAVRSTQDIDYDGLMICGSDNLATAGYIYKGCEFIRKGIDFAKASALYVYNVQSRDTFYTSLKNIGGCSFFSVNAVRKCGFTLWPANRNAGIDSNISSRLLVRGIAQIGVIPVPILEGDACFVDMKSHTSKEGEEHSDNINSFARVAEFFKNEYVEIDGMSFFKRYFPQEWNAVNCLAE